jgi:hypothetical protein
VPTHSYGRDLQPLRDLGRRVTASQHREHLCLATGESRAAGAEPPQLRQQIEHHPSGNDRLTAGHGADDPPQAARVNSAGRVADGAGANALDHVCGIDVV